jgi:hypothetical protein
MADLSTNVPADSFERRSLIEKDTPATLSVGTHC